MGRYDTVKTAVWRLYLQSLGGKFVRIKGDHEIWSVPGADRAIVFRAADKEIPLFHIKTNLRTLGKTMKDLGDWMDT